MSRIFRLLLLLTCLQMTAAFAVELSQGVLADVSAEEHGVRVFRGIPYAAAPSGAMRWRPPGAPPTWSGVRSASRFGAACLQTRMFVENPAVPADMSEDCLFLNIWVPPQASERPLPVLVWIHGGAYVIGSGSSSNTDPTLLASRGLIVVTFNYRVGVFGFLSHAWLTQESADHVSGNYGIMDQIAALHWVQNNIAAFGGDPHRVSIAGHSAGSTSVNILMVSPEARGLFQRAIGQSGAAMSAAGLNDGSPLPRSLEESKGARFVESLRVSNLTELRSLPAVDLLHAAGNNWADWAWNASIDGKVLPKPPAEIFAAHRQNDVPLLVGWNTQEGASIGRATFGDDTSSFREQIVQRFGRHARQLFELYPANTPDQERRAKVALAGEGFISYPSWLWAGAQAASGSAPVYVYTFSYRPPFPPGFMHEVVLGDPGAYHGATLLYVFGNFALHPDWQFDRADYRLADRMQTYWVNFATSGDPNGPGLPVWPQFGRGPAHQKLYITQAGTSGSRDAEARHFESLGRLLRSSPGALSYRGMDAERWLTHR